MGAPLPEKWNPENEPACVGAGAVTLVERSSFCICTSVEVTGEEALVEGLPSDIELRCEPYLMEGTLPA
jgi:hypothetical protein